MEKDFKAWPGSFPGENNQATQPPPQAERTPSPLHKQHSSDTGTFEVPMKQLANNNNSGTSMSKLPRPSRWDVAESHAQRPKSNGFIGRAYSLFTGGDSPNREPGGALEEHYQMLLAKSESRSEKLKQDNHKLQQELHATKVKCDQSVRAEIEKCHDIFNQIKGRHNAELARKQQSHLYEVNRIRQEACGFIEAACKEKYLADQSCKKFEQEIEASEEKIRNLQCIQMQSVEATQWAPQSASEIEHKLKSVLARVRQWAAEYSALDIDDILEPEFFASLATRLANRGCMVDADRLYHALTESKAVQKSCKAFAMLLAAAVSFDIMQKTIGDPFCAFVGGVNDKFLVGDRHGKCFRAYVKLISRYDVAGAEGFRCQILRLLDPGLNGKRGVESIKKIASESRQAAASQIATGIFDEFKGTLLPDKAGDALAGLQALTLETAELSWELWTRKSRIEVLDWARVQQESDKVIKFSATAKALEAHALHNRYLEDDPEALDGTEVVMLCSPVIIAAGNAEGQDYDKERLLKKAVVWLG